MSNQNRDKTIARKRQMQTRSGGSGNLVLFLLGVLLVIGNIVWTSARNSDVAATLSPMGAAPRR